MRPFFLSLSYCVVLINVLLPRLKGKDQRKKKDREKKWEGNRQKSECDGTGVKVIHVSQINEINSMIHEIISLEIYH